MKNDNESSVVEDYVYKLPPPKSKSDVNDRAPNNLPKDVKSVLDIKIVCVVFINEYIVNV